MHALTPELPEFPHSIAPVQEADGVDEHALAEHIESYTPLVLRGYAKDWPMAQKFAGADSAATIDTIRPLLGDANIPFTLLPAEQKSDIGIGNDLRANFRIDDKVAPVSEFLQTIAEFSASSTRECAYAASMPLQKFPQIETLLPPANPVEGRDSWNRLLWVGSGRHVVDLHHDQMLNFITMFAGVKRVTLLPPTALPLVYRAPLHKTVGVVPRSLVKLLSVDLSQYPRFEAALPLARQVVLYPGDTLYIPPLWWHYVESYGVNVMLNAWHKDLVDPAQLAAGNQLLRSAIVDSHDGSNLATTREGAQEALSTLPAYWRD